MFSSIILDMFDYISGDKDTFEDFLSYMDISDDQFFDERQRFKLDKKWEDITKGGERIVRWRPVTGVITPGGDPAYECPICEDRRSYHINGVEMHHDYKFCPYCGTRLEY